ncbi:hypothetical protein V6N13_063844 [Hibiscus sabdariffa]
MPMIDLRIEAATELLRCQPIGGCSVQNSIIPLYAIAIDPRNPNLFAVVGLYQYARPYDICKYKYGGLTDFGQPIDYFYPPHDMGLGHNPVPFSPSSSCCEANGNVYIWKKKGGELVGAKKEHVLEVDCIEPHPHTTVLASSGADGIKIWTPNAIDKGKLATTKIEHEQLLELRYVDETRSNQPRRMEKMELDCSPVPYPV